MAQKVRVHYRSLSGFDLSMVIEPKNAIGKWAWGKFRWYLVGIDEYGYETYIDFERINCTTPPEQYEPHKRFKYSGFGPTRVSSMSELPPTYPS